MGYKWTDAPDYERPVFEPRQLAAPEALVHDLQVLVQRIADAFASHDGAELTAISDEFMGYADDLADHGRELLPKPLGTAPRLYLCAVCHRNPVAAEDGYDTCDDCLRRV